MKANLFFTKTRWLVTIILLLSLGITNAWGTEEVAYTLTAAATGGNSSPHNSYNDAATGWSCTDANDVTIDWSVIGNSYMVPWRIGGGKNTSGTNTNRYIYSQTAITENITKVVVTHGSKSNMTVNSVTLNVYSTAAKAVTGGTGDISSVSVTYVDNGNMTFSRPAGHNWAGRFFRIDYDLTWTSSKSAKYILFSSAVFKYESGPSCETAPTVGAPSNSSVSVNTATVSCSDGITKGSCDISEYGFYYGTTNGVTTSNATKHKVGDGTAGNNVSSYSWDMTSLTANTHYYVKAYAIAGGTTTLSTNQTDFTTCKAAAPNHVDITPTAESGNYGYRYTIGETIKLTATAYATSNTSSPIASGNITGYQWQKYKGSSFVDIEDGEDATDGGTFSGTTSANLQISGCTTSNTGSYRCVISTGASCSTESSGYMVYVYTLNGNYYGEDWDENAIVWTSETTGTVTLSLNASSTYMFKVKDNDTKSYGREANNFIIEPWQQNCNTNNQDIRLFTGPAGTYTFTIDITNAQAGTPVANVKVDYPDVTHPVTGYMYVPKWWTCYPHWWDGSGNALTSDGSDPAITKYTTICGEDYWYMPVLDNYVNVAVKDNATWASASNNSGNQTTTDHSGMMLTNDGSWKWQSFTTYTITYAKGDGTGDAMATSSGICPSADQDLTANSYTAPSHKHFSGWKTNTALTYVAYGDDDDGTHEVAVAVNGIVPDRAKIKEVGGNITLTAQWAYNTTTVTLKKNGGTGNNQTVLATYGSAMPLTTTSDEAIAVHTKAGYALLGYWDTDASTGGNQYYSYDGSTLSSYANWDKDDASIDLYARWEEKVDQFIDDLHETSGYTSASPHEESGAGYTVPGPLAGDKTTGNDCRKAHYVFVGWVISGGQNANGTIKGTPKIWQPGESNNASGATYYAVWAAEE